MKLMIALLMTVFSPSTHATSPPVQNQILLEQTMHVGFVPIDRVGVYRFQVLTDGTIQRIDNKNLLTVVGSLSEIMISKIVTQIDLIQNDELEHPTTPPCMDAPKLSLTVTQSTHKQLKIWEQFNCRTHTAKDPKAKNTADWIIKLVGVFSGLDYLN